MLASSREPRGGARSRGRDLRPKSRRCAAVGLRNAPAGAANPAPTNIFASRTNRNGCGRPGGRRAGCPHPAAPRGIAYIPVLNRRGAAGVNARPTERGKHSGRPGRRNLAQTQTSVGADSISARLALPQGPAGGPWPSPTNRGERPPRLYRAAPSAFAKTNRTGLATMTKTAPRARQAAAYGKNHTAAGRARRRASGTATRVKNTWCTKNTA